ncbi:hypothetical protein [uncultured Roseobacter sp.]|uniref:hypothetical protein n=1 Tax=uncultured Roseobacter sp. TaxID=114847 RepID=UPI00263893B4|nr:hypothetical protein [uncultured Roseobacter sp.]
MHNICTFTGCGYGTSALKEKWARDLTSGRKLANFPLTEPQYGSDPMNMYSRATISGDGTTEISRVVIGRAVQKRAATSPDPAVPTGFGETS